MPRPAPSSRRRRGGGASRGRGAKPARTLFEISAGGVIYRRADDAVDVCLIATRGNTRWQLPKGKQEKGESLEDTARREVAEETGLTGKVGPQLDKIDLWFTWTENGTAVRHHKLVYFYLLEYERGSTRDHDHEVDEARWFPADEAIARLTFASEKKVVARALEVLGERAAPAESSAR